MCQPGTSVLPAPPAAARYGGASAAAHAGATEPGYASGIPTSFDSPYRPGEKPAIHRIARGPRAPALAARCNAIAGIGLIRRFPPASLGFAGVAWLIGFARRRTEG